MLYFCALILNSKSLIGMWDNTGQHHCKHLYRYTVYYDSGNTNNIFHSEDSALIPSLRLHTHTNTQMSHPSSLLSCFSLSVSLWHPSLSTPMDYQTNFYHYTLQVKKRSRGCAAYGPLRFLCSAYRLVHHCPARHSCAPGP